MNKRLLASSSAIGSLSHGPLVRHAADTRPVLRSITEIFSLSRTFTKILLPAFSGWDDSRMPVEPDVSQPIPLRIDLTKGSASLADVEAIGDGIVADVVRVVAVWNRLELSE